MRILYKHFKSMFSSVYYTVQLCLFFHSPKTSTVNILIGCQVPVSDRKQIKIFRFDLSPDFKFALSIVCINLIQVFYTAPNSFSNATFFYMPPVLHDTRVQRVKMEPGVYLTKSIGVRRS